MSKIEAMRKALSPEALAEVETLGGEHTGYVVQMHPAKAPVMIELRAFGVIGDNDGLTRLGSALAGVMKAEYMDRMF